MTTEEHAAAVFRTILMRNGFHPHLTPDGAGAIREVIAEAIRGAVAAALAECREVKRLLAVENADLRARLYG